MVSINEFAKSISGKEYGYPQFTKEEIEIAKENGFVIVYVLSDDMMEFDGAIYDEIGVHDGRKTYFSKTEICTGIRPSTEKFPNCIISHWCAETENGKPICWTYETEIPHETFMIYEGGEPYCRGIVFSIDDVK